MPTKTNTARKPSLNSIIRSAERSIATVEQIFADVARWNRLHPDEQPIDPDPDGEMAAVKRYAEAMIKECRRPRKIGEPLIVRAPLPKSVQHRLREDPNANNT